MTERRWLLLTLFTLALLSLIPVFHATLAGVGFAGVPCGDNYYCSRMREVADGYPLIGNSYFYEHRESLAPAFLFPDLVSALPLLLGFSMAEMVTIDFVLWSAVFGVLLFYVFRRLGLTAGWSSFGTLATFYVVYFQMQHPVSMQLVHPAFLFFLLMFLKWWENPQKKYAGVLLALGVAAPFYAYQYLWQLVVVFLGLVFFYLLWRRDWKTLTQYVVAGIYTFILILPVIVLTVLQILHPLYVETMLRVGLAYTRLPSGEAFISLARMLPWALAAFLTARWICTGERFERERSSLYLLITLAAAIEIVSVSNAITGLDLETASHLARFVLIWLPIASVALFYYLWRERARFPALATGKKFVLFGLMVVILGTNIYYAPRPSEFAPTPARRQALKELSELQHAFSWLNSNISEQAIIWVHPRSDLGITIPIYTKHYLLFANTGILNLISDEEARERYLVASTLSDISVETIAEDVWVFAGAGYAKDTPNTINRAVKYCKLLNLEKFGWDCGREVDSDTLYSEIYERMFERYTEEIGPKREEFVKKYGVSYVVIDKKEGLDFHPEKWPGASMVFEDERVAIYALE